MLVSRLAPRAGRTALPRLVHTEARIKELGLELPAMPVPLASYTTCVRSGSHLFLAGHVPFTPDMKGLIKPGKCGKDYTTEEGAEIAKFMQSRPDAYFRVRFAGAKECKSQVVSCVRK